MAFNGNIFPGTYDLRLQVREIVIKRIIIFVIKLPAYRYSDFIGKIPGKFRIKALFVSGGIAALIRVEDNLPDQLVNLLFFFIFAETYCS